VDRSFLPIEVAEIARLGDDLLRFTVAEEKGLDVAEGAAVPDGHQPLKASVPMEARTKFVYDGRASKDQGVAVYCHRGHGFAWRAHDKQWATYGYDDDR